MYAICRLQSQVNPEELTNSTSNQVWQGICENVELVLFTHLKISYDFSEFSMNL